MIGLSEFFPMWEEIEPSVRARLEEAAVERRAGAGESLHSGSGECTGLILVRRGRLRAFALSEEGRQITLYRLLERDVCLFSASCMIHDLQFEVAIEAEEESEFFLIPAEVYQSMMERSAPLANFTGRLMASRFSDVMWLMGEILWKKFDHRLADFLLEERALAGEDKLNITHEAMANHLGTAREVVTRMLNYFQGEGLIRLTRGSVEILDRAGLEKL